MATQYTILKGDCSENRRGGELMGGSEGGCSA